MVLTIFNPSRLLGLFDGQLLQQKRVLSSVLLQECRILLRKLLHSVGSELLGVSGGSGRKLQMNIQKWPKYPKISQYPSSNHSVVIRFPSFSSFLVGIQQQDLSILQVAPHRLLGCCNCQHPLLSQGHQPLLDGVGHVHRLVGETQKRVPRLQFALKTWPKPKLRGQYRLEMICHWKKETQTKHQRIPRTVWVMFEYYTVDLYREHHLEQSLLQFSTFRCVSADVGSRSPSCVGITQAMRLWKSCSFRCAPQVVTGAWTWINRCPHRHMAVTRHQMTVMRP